MVFLPPSGEHVPVVWRLRRSLEMLAFLALSNDRWAADEAIGGVLWPEADADVYSRNLAPTVSDARRALAEAAGGDLETVFRTQGGYALSPAVRWQVDVAAFHRDAERASVLLDLDPRRALRSGERAWRRFRGALLEGFGGGWIEDRRELLARRYRRLLRTVAASASALGEAQQAMDAYRSILVVDPYDEEAHLALMEIYSRNRRPDLVRRQFMRMEDLLRELDVEPRAATRNRYLTLVSRGPSEPLGPDAAD